MAILCLSDQLFYLEATNVKVMREHLATDYPLTPRNLLELLGQPLEDHLERPWLTVAVSEHAILLRDGSNHGNRDYQINLRLPKLKVLQENSSSLAPSSYFLGR